MDVRVGLWRKLSTKELMLLNCGVGEDSFESPLDCKEIQPVHSKGDQSWDFFGRNDAKLQYFGYLMQRVDSLEKTLMLGGIGTGGEGDNRGWDGWMASPTQCRWVWVNYGSWWWTERPGVLLFMGSQWVRHDWATELNWTFVAKKGIAITYLNKIITSLCFENNLQLSLYFILRQLSLVILVWQMRKPKHRTGTCLIITSRCLLLKLIAIGGV